MFCLLNLNHKYPQLISESGRWLFDIEDIIITSRNLYLLYRASSSLAKSSFRPVRNLVLNCKMTISPFRYTSAGRPKVSLAIDSGNIPTQGYKYLDSRKPTRSKWLLLMNMSSTSVPTPPTEMAGYNQIMHTKRRIFSVGSNSRPLMNLSIFDK
jgi:hypothetical protein